MVVKQILLDFRVPQLADKNNSEEQDAVNIASELLKTHVGATGPTLTSTSEGFGKLLVYEDRDRSQCTVRVMPDGLVTIDILFRMDCRDNKEVQQIFEDLKDAVKKRRLESSEVVPPISRGTDIKNYHDTSDGRLKEYDFDKVVYEGSSEYQDILVVHSQQFGNMLFLDDNEMLAESDIAYTRALLGNGREDYRDKTILILGGGDGGIIHEVLKESPKFVTMVEIDQLVIDVAKKHLRKVCGSTLDTLKGSNYEIIVDDCYKVLRKYIQEGTVFDYILNDLTDIPIGAEGIQEKAWTFIKDVLDLSLQVLHKNGKYYAQGTNGVINLTYQKRYEKILSSYPIEFSKECTFVPSFLELWTFYEVWNKP